MHHICVVECKTKKGGVLRNNSHVLRSTLRGHLDSHVVFESY